MRMEVKMDGGEEWSTGERRGVDGNDGERKRLEG